MPISSSIARNNLELVYNTRARTESGTMATSKELLQGCRGEVLSSWSSIMVSIRVCLKAGNLQVVVVVGGGVGELTNPFEQ